MGNINLNELAALQLVLEYVPVKELLASAMNHMAEQADTRSKDNADVCCKAIATFLK